MEYWDTFTIIADFNRARASYNRQCDITIVYSKTAIVLLMIGRQVPIEMASTNNRVKVWSPVINELNIETFTILYNIILLVLDA